MPFGAKTWGKQGISPLDFPETDVRTFAIREGPHINNSSEDGAVLAILVPACFTPGLLL